MKIHRFIGDFDLSKKEVVIKNPENINQIKKVLRLKKGDQIILLDGRGAETEVTLTFVSNDKITGEIKTNPASLPAGQAGTPLAEVTKKINLYLAILKKENFELAAQKATECGISKIIPIITERTIKTGINMKRLEKIILEASEQSGRNTVPTLSPILKFTEALIDAKNSEEKIIFHLAENTYSPDKNAKTSSIFVGPEGGFTEKEIELAKNTGFTIASLGSLTMRGETAAIVATYRAVNKI